MAQHHRTEREITAEDLDRLPIFPLPRAVLFPGVVLPLHLFEPRYRALGERCVSGGGLLGLAALKPGFEDDYLGQPPVFPVLGLGRVVAAQHLPDGRWNIALHGVCRVEVVEEPPLDEPFRVVRARRLEERERYGDRVAADRLRGVVLQLAARLPEIRRELGPLLPAAQRPGQLADVAAGLMIEGFPARQRLLEETDVARRLDLLLELLVDLLLATSRDPGSDTSRH